jgi:hypothetical protein
MVNDASTVHKESCVKVKHGESSPSLAHNDKSKLTFEVTDRSGVQPMNVERELSELQEDLEHVPQEKEQMREWSQQRAKVSQSYEGEIKSDASPRPTRGYTKSKHLDAVRENTSPERTKHYEALPSEDELPRGKHQETPQRLRAEENESRIKSLQMDFFALQRRYEEQSSALAFTRSELRSCQSQLDNVQRFISTADRHADQDIIQMLQGLNEEVYKMSMTMADYVTEGFTRQSATARQTREQVHAGESVLGMIGQALMNHLAAVENQDVALFLQIAFQGYLSHLMCHIVSSWTIDQRLNTFIEETYQRLRKAETQTISGRWRSLTRTHILPTLVSDPKVSVEYAMTGLTDIVMATGLVSTRRDASSKLLSRFGEKILSLVSHAGRLGNMVSEMISGEFQVFVVQAGDAFDGKRMMDMNGDKTAPRGTGAVQTVLCVSRVGLKKQMGEKIIMLTKAQVVLRSFLD